MWLFVNFVTNVLKSWMNDHDFLWVCACFKWVCQFLGNKKGLPFFWGNNWAFSCHIHSPVCHNLLLSTECSRISYECSTFFGAVSLYVLPYPFCSRDHSYFFWHTPVHYNKCYKKSSECACFRKSLPPFLWHTAVINCHVHLCEY